MKSHVAELEYRTICLRIVPITGTPIYLTRHPYNLVMNGHTYVSGAGYEHTGYSATTSMSPAMVDLEGIAGIAGIGYDEIASGTFDSARAYLFATTWANPIEDEEPITASILGKTTLQDDRYKIEEMALIDVLNQTVGETYTASCQKKFGGQEFAGCKKNLAAITVTGTITHLTSNLVFRDSARTEAADYFGLGTVQITSGLNAGLKPLEIKSYAADGTIEIYEQFHYPLEVGDTYTMIPGCRKTLSACSSKWNNVINFGGFSNIPTSSQYSYVGTG